MNITVGKVLGKLALGIGATTIAVYADYRIKGGPPLRQLYKTVKAERLRTEEENRAALMKMPVVCEGTVE